MKVRDVTRPGAPLYKMANALHASVPELDPDDIAPRLQRLAAIRAKKYTMEILSDFPYEEIAQIFVRVNSGGGRCGRLDLALATLSARWPGVLDKLETEADHWEKEGYGDIDATFLTRALTGAVLGRGLSTWSHARLVAATDEQLEQGWATVRRGLRDLVPLLKNNLKVSRSSLLPSMIVLLPLIVLLGERPDEPLPIETANALLYWLLVATIRNRYSSATDTTLGQDIPAARLPDPARELLKNLGIVGTRIEVTPRDLAGRSVNSPYFLLSFLVAQRKEARDWWYATVIAPGGSGPQKLEYHHIHPRARLAGQPEKYTQGRDQRPRQLRVHLGQGEQENQRPVTRGLLPDPRQRRVGRPLRTTRRGTPHRGGLPRLPRCTPKAARVRDDQPARQVLPGLALGRRGRTR